VSVGPVVRDEATAEFFDGTAARQFLLRRCPARHFSEPPAAQCTTCGATDLHWTPASGAATLVSWAVTWSRPAAGEPQVRTVLVIGELDEGPWWWGQLAGTSADDGEADDQLADCGVPESGGEVRLTVGQALRIEFRRAEGEYEAVPVFVLA
jgi:uncharacterized OB-fold protein